MSVFDDAFGLPRRSRPSPIKIVGGTYVGPNRWRVIHPGFDPPGTLGETSSSNVVDLKSVKVVPVPAMRPEDV